MAALNEALADPGELRVDLHGAIAGILALCAHGKAPGREVRALAEQLVLVAGACNHREFRISAQV